MNSQPGQKPNNPWVSLVVDIALPVIILNKLSPYLGEDGPFYALLLAISLPFGHGVYGFIKEKRINWMSLLGLLNVLLTGGFALLKLEGIWFAVKEAGFPSLIGIFVFFSSFSKKPLFGFLLNQPGLFATARINEKLDLLNSHDQYRLLIKRCTLFFSGTFFLSAILNFVLAVNIFKPIPKDLSETESANLLNQQIADMTWLSYIVIVLPLMIITSALFYYCIKNLSKITELEFNELVHS